MEKKTVLADYRIACLSREASLLGRKEVLSGKAKFGIFGDGKEVAQLALARHVNHGDWRSGYYRDQTLMMALGLCTVRQFFAQLYADTDPNHDPFSSGRQMNNHFATKYYENGRWLDQRQQFHSTSDISPTGGQMARLLGLAYASKLYRQNKRLQGYSLFSDRGNEVAFGTIGNASTSEGPFWETMNAACVLQVPLVMCVWDDDYGISVANEYQTVKGSISQALAGFEKKKDAKGMEIFVVEGWDYPKLCKTFEKANAVARKDHVPVLVHVVQLTQPQGHSTSGSHERYKSAERLQYESSIDCLTKMRQWIVAEKIAEASELESIEKSAKEEVRRESEGAWNDYMAPIRNERSELASLLEEIGTDAALKLKSEHERQQSFNRRLLASSARKLQVQHPHPALLRWLLVYQTEQEIRYDRFWIGKNASEPIYSSCFYGENPTKVDGRQIIQKFFDIAIENDPRIFIIGEDIGKLGGVNLEFDGLQEKYSDLHVTDTGIREATILGQGLGAAMRGLRPIVDIQYLDYLLYCFQGLSDDLATLHYRSGGTQIAPVIVRTKGHRLEGIWHTGSPMGVILSGLRGMHVCVPRNMTQAAGMYATLLQQDNPALVIEVLNGYRVKEAMPENLGDFCLELGVPEILRQGTDLTLVTYGACVRVAEEACQFLAGMGIEVELIDVQTLLPFDVRGLIAQSVARTNALICLDEDVPGGASAYMLQQIVEGQRCFDDLEVSPATIAAKHHRAAYASDGDYWSKPQVEDIIEKVYDMMSVRDPQRFPPRGDFNG